MTGYKDWIQNKAEDIANQEYGLGFYDLPEQTQTVVYNRAMEAHKDYVADQIDKARDDERYRRLGL